LVFVGSVSSALYPLVSSLSHISYQNAGSSHILSHSTSIEGCPSQTNPSLRCHIDASSMQLTMVTVKLQRVMNSAARVITNTRKFDHGLSHVRHEILHWLVVPERVTFKLYLSVYNCLHGMGPPYLSEMCQPISSLPGRRHLRSAVRGQLAVPRYRLTTAGRIAFSFADPSALNSLPTYLNDHTLNLDSFKRFLKSFLFQM